MRNMKENLLNKIGEKTANVLGDASIKLCKKSFDKCMWFLCYEPKIPMEILKENMEKESEK